MQQPASSSTSRSTVGGSSAGAASALGDAAEPGTVRGAPAEKLPRDELNTLAEDFGLDPTRYATRGELLEALGRRKRLIHDLDREGMLEVIRWGRRPVATNATKEQLALEIARIKRVSYGGLSRDGLLTLALLRGVKCAGEESESQLIRKLRRQEGIIAKLNRRRRSFIAGLAARMVGDEDGHDEPYRHLAPNEDPKTPSEPPTSLARPASLREQIEERGLFGGLADRVRRSADTYVNHKLDEIETRIDRKLDEIDNRLAEWRDKEIANRVRIIKITLWASVIVSLVSLIYAYITRVAM